LRAKTGWRRGEEKRGGGGKSPVALRGENAPAQGSSTSRRQRLATALPGWAGDGDRHIMAAIGSLGRNPQPRGEAEKKKNREGENARALCRKHQSDGSRPVGGGGGARPGTYRRK